MAFVRLEIAIEKNVTIELQEPSDKWDITQWSLNVVGTNTDLQIIYQKAIFKASLTILFDPVMFGSNTLLQKVLQNEAPHVISGQKKTKMGLEPTIF